MEGEKLEKVVETDMKDTSLLRKEIEMWRRIPLLLIILVVLVYFFVYSSAFLSRLALETNEAFEGLHALKVLQHKVDSGFPWMLMSLEYEGHLVAYLLVPLLAVFGPSVFMIRFIYVVFSLISLFCIFYVCKRWFKTSIALITIFLLGINTNFIRCTRVGSLRDEILQISLVWLGIALIQLYIDKKKKICLYTSALIFGLALWAKIMFLGFLLAAVATFSLFSRKGVGFLKGQIFTIRRDLAIFLLMFVIGSSPFIIHNILLGGITFRYLWYYFWNPTIYGYNNLLILKNLSSRISELLMILSNSNSPDTLSITKNYFHVILFFISFLGILVYIVFSKKSPISKNKLSFLISVYSILFLLMCFVPQNRTVEHIILLFPFVQIIEATFIFLLFVFLKNIISPIGFILLILCPHICLEFYTISKFLIDVKNEKGVEYFSSVINDIASYTQKNNIKKLFAMSEYLLEGNVDFLTNLNVKVRELFEIYPYSTRLDNDSLNNIIESIYKTEMEDLSQIYIIVWKNGNFKEYTQRAFETLSKIAAEEGKEIRLIKNFVSKTDGAFFELCIIK